MTPTPAAQERAMKLTEVILQTMSGKLSWIQAADILGVTPRTMRRWRARYQQFGVKGLHDQRRVDRSPHSVPEAELKRWFQLYECRYAGFNVRHFYSRLKRQHLCRWSYSVVLRALQGAGLAKKKRPRGRHFIRREPKACFGEMLHIDGSRHRWLTHSPNTWLCLVAVVDDATRRLLYARLVEQESTHAILSALAAVIRQHGIPQELYTDRASWAARTPKRGEPIDRSMQTQVQRALERLGVKHIVAYSPQARGRSERVNRTLQDRLVKELASAGVRSMDRANAYLERVFVGSYNDEFAHPAADPETGFAPLGSADLEAILCHEEPRTVQKDNTVTLEGIRLQIAKQPGRATCAGLPVLVRRHLDGTHTIGLGPKPLGRYSAQGRAPSRASLVHQATAPSSGVAA